MRNLIESDNTITGHSISFIDIDETTFHTFAHVNVYNSNGKLVRTLDNQEFNTDVLKPGEKYDFSEFQNAEVFNTTSKPIVPIVQKIQRIISSIKRHNKKERVIFLTARSDFDDKKLFLQTFQENGIDVEFPNVHIERSGNLQKFKTVAERKRYVILKYLRTAEYTAVRMYDDDDANLQTFMELGKQINEGQYGILKMVMNKYPRVRRIYFYPLKVNEHGKIIKFH